MAAARLLGLALAALAYVYAAAAAAAAQPAAEPDWARGVVEAWSVEGVAHKAAALEGKCGVSVGVVD